MDGAGWIHSAARMNAAARFASHVHARLLIVIWAHVRANTIVRRAERIARHGHVARVARLDVLRHLDGAIGHRPVPFLRARPGQVVVAARKAAVVRDACHDTPGKREMSESGRVQAHMRGRACRTMRVLRLRHIARISGQHSRGRAHVLRLRVDVGRARIRHAEALDPADRREAALVARARTEAAV